MTTTVPAPDTYFMRMARRALDGLHATPAPGAVERLARWLAVAVPGRLWDYGVILAEDGTIQLETRLTRSRTGARPESRYVSRGTLYRVTGEPYPTHADLACGAVARATGMRALHVTLYRLMSIGGERGARAA